RGGTMESKSEGSIRWAIIPPITMAYRPMFTLQFKASAIRPTTPTRARRLADASVDPTDARKATVRRFGRSDRSAQAIVTGLRERVPRPCMGIMAAGVRRDGLGIGK